MAIERFGALDILVNNAGIAPAGNLVDQSLDLWQQIINVNLLSPMILARAASDYFLPQRRGKIINIASISGIRGKPSLAAYSASKGGLIRFTEALSAEWAASGIQVNAVAPGAFETAAQAAVLDSEELLARRVRKIPARRMGRTREIGPLVCYLASSLSDYVTGAVFVIDGGEVSKI